MRSFVIFYFLQNVIKVITSSKMIWVGHVAWRGKMLMEINHLQGLGVGVKKILGGIG
jgi:hypothetical protein